jgi:hypothetical protein
LEGRHFADARGWNKEFELQSVRLGRWVGLQVPSAVAERKCGEERKIWKGRRPGIYAWCLEVPRKNRGLVGSQLSRFFGGPKLIGDVASMRMRSALAA